MIQRARSQRLTSTFALISSSVEGNCNLYKMDTINLYKMDTIYGFRRDVHKICGLVL
jgi:hypothetical protein